MRGWTIAPWPRRFSFIPLQLATGLSIALLVNTGFHESRSLLYTRWLIDRPVYFLSMQNLGWVVGWIVLAEHWRATAIVLVTLVLARHVAAP